MNEAEIAKQVRVLYEDNHLIAIYKPFGMPSQGDKTGDFCATDWVENYLRETYQKPGNIYVGLLHRLDRPAAGVMVLAKTSKAAKRMSAMFQSREVEKQYLLIAKGVPQPLAGSLKHFMSPIPGRQNMMRAFDEERNDRKVAKLQYETVAQKDGQALVKVELETGRKHQIRVQMAKIGCGIVGDAKYCKTDFLPDQSIALLAWRIAFQHPVKKEDRIVIEAPLPQNGIWEGWKVQ